MNKFWKPALLVAAAVVMAIGMLGSGAWWTASQTTDTETLSSGTLELSEVGFAAFDLGTVPPMAPGDKTGEAVLTIRNTGTTNLAWFGDLIVEGDAMLKDAIYIDYAQMEFLSPTNNNWQQQGTDNFILDGKGSGPYPAWYNTLAAKPPFVGVISLSTFDGNSAMGVAPYEFNGALKPGYAYRLTLKFGFAEAADNDYQNLSELNISFTAKAAQITEGAIRAENPGHWAIPDLLTWLNNQILDQTEG